MSGLAARGLGLGLASCDLTVTSCDITGLGGIDAIVHSDVYFSWFVTVVIASQSIFSFYRFFCFFDHLDILFLFLKMKTLGLRCETTQVVRFHVRALRCGVGRRLTLAVSEKSHCCHN